MNTSGNENPIEKAEDIIERFGGIRPMAKKMDVAVTTVQGWKKRGVIPAVRREAILAAALANDVDLSGLMTGEAAVSPSPVSAKAQAVVLSVPVDEDASAETLESTENEIVAEAVADDDVPEQPDAAEDKQPSIEPESHKPEVFGGTPFPRSLSGAPERPPVMKPAGKPLSAGAWINLVLALIIVAGLAALLWPRMSNHRTEEERLKSLEQQVAKVEERQSFFGTLIPKDLDKQLESLRDQAGEAQEQIGQAVEKAQEISNDVLAENAGTLEERADRLGHHLQDLASSPALAGMAERLRAWSGQQEGQEQISQAIAELGAIITSMGGQMNDFGNRLHAARLQSTTLNKMFDGVPASDLKAAALLLGVTQFRSSLDRDNQPFAEDLDVVKGLVGQDDPALLAALDRLAPSAEQGVLTPSGLGVEFRAVAGEAVVDSLKGEDVSFAERAKARLNDVLQVEKNGELVTGTQTQAALSKTEKLLDAGDLEGAIAETRVLKGPAAETMAPWVDKAEATLAAQKVDEMLERIVGSGGTNLALPGSPLPVMPDEGAGVSVQD